MAGPPKVTPGLTITRAESEEIFIRDLKKYETTVNKAVKVPITQNQFDALTSLCFNIGQSAFAKSTVVRRLNQGDVQGAANAILMWSKQPELMPRRQAERAQFLTGVKRPVEAPRKPVEEGEAPEAPEVPEEDEEPFLKPLGKSKEVWGGGLGIVATVSAFISSMTGLDAKAQMIILGGICAVGTVGGFIVIANRLMARKKGLR